MEKNFTVNLAKSRLSVGYTKNDNQFVKYWEDNAVFKNVNESLDNLHTKEEHKKPFVLLDGPPYANGDAHLGHGLNKMLKDLVLKSRWFMGQSVVYQPGWDTHGLPLELAVEKKYGKLDNETLKKRCKQLAFRSLVKQRKSFKRLGVLGDWNRPYVTLSQGMLQQSWKTLSNLSSKGLLQYKQFPVHHCPACASSLAEAELENKLMPKDSLYFKMQLFNADDTDSLPTYALVWTTTPWTLLMNQGLVYNNSFEYELWTNNKENLYTQNGKDVEQWLLDNGYTFVESFSGACLSNLTAASPLTKLVVPVLHADFVEEGKTGFVHMASSHGPEDYQLGQDNGVMPKTYLNKHGVFSLENESLDPALKEALHNKKYTTVASVVCDLLKADLVKYSKSETEQQVCWRHKCGVYYNATYQVFLELEKPEYNLKDKVKVVLDNSELPVSYQEKLKQMLLGRPHWCLSRQRQWGCPMNLLVNKKDNTLSSLSSEYLLLLSQGKQQQADDLLSAHPEVFLFTDVVDVWFDSGNVANDYMARHGQSVENYAVDLVLEGKDQYRGWFQSLLWLTVADNETMPYKHVLCHGFVLNEKREKFAKSSGNAKTVETYADVYGSDVLHLWTASQEPENDAVFSESKLEEMKRYYSRLRLSLRFLTSNLYGYDTSVHAKLLAQYKDHPQFDMHRYVLKTVGELYTQCKQYFEQYQFKKALDLVYHFCDKTLSNFYFEALKNTLYLRHLDSEKRLMTQVALFELMNSLFDLVKVFCPFVAEEFYQDYYGKGSVFENMHLYNQHLSYQNYTAMHDWEKVNFYRKEVLASLDPYQKDKTLKSRTEACVDLTMDETQLRNLKEVAKNYLLSDLFSVSEVCLSVGAFSINVNDLKQNSSYAKCPRCWNYSVASGFVNNLCLCCNQDN